MFPLSCTRVARTQVMRRAHARKLGAHRNGYYFLKYVFAHSFYISFHIQINSGKILHSRNFMRTQILKN